MVTNTMPAVPTPAVRPLQPSDFVHIDVDLASATRLLHDARMTEWLAAVGGVHLVRYGGRLHDDRILCITLAAPGGVIQIAMPAATMPALTVACANVMQSMLSLLPLMATRMLAPVLQRLGTAADVLADRGWLAISVTGVRLHVVADHGRLPVPLASWEWTWEAEFQSSAAVLAIDPGCVAALQQLIARLPVRESPAASGWRVGSVLRVGSRRLAVDLLRSLAVGDVVLFHDQGDIDRLDARLYCGVASGRHWSAAVSISQRKVSLMSELQMHDGKTDSDLDVPGPPLESHVAELDVPVHFELDNAALSLAQLNALRPGYVIDLSIPVQDAEIRLVACGQVIGRGRLVVIGDCLGVQIEQLTGGIA